MWYDFICSGTCLILTDHDAVAVPMVTNSAAFPGETVSYLRSVPCVCLPDKPNVPYFAKPGLYGRQHADHTVRYSM